MCDSDLFKELAEIIATEQIATVNTKYTLSSTEEELP